MPAALSDVSRVLQRHPFRSIAGLLAVAALIELLQVVQELFFGGHALGEVVRNLAYALVGALVFQWLVVELPARERRRKSYDFHRQTFEVLLTAGPGLLEPYRQAASQLGLDLDVWNRDAVMTHATSAMAPVLADSQIASD